jgi:iron-sulfur cluster assembly protein
MSEEKFNNTIEQNVQKEIIMFIVSENAQDQIAKYFKINEIKPIRVFLSQGCSGPRIAMAVDEIRNTDKVFKINGVEYVVEKELLKQAQPIEVDFMGDGFQISTSLKLGGGCSGCGSTGSCG